MDITWEMMIVVKLTKNQKDEMKKWNLDVNKILDLNIDFTRLKYNELKELYDVCTTPGQLAIRVARYKVPGIIDSFL